MTSKRNDKFVPSGKLLNKMLRILLKNTMGRTALAKKINVNYMRFLQHLTWLEQKDFIKLVIEQGKVNVVLTETGKKFAKTIISSK